MNRLTPDPKRQILANLLTGKVDTLRVYQSQRQQQESPFRLIIDSRAIDGIVKGIDKQGNENLMSQHDLDHATNLPPIWIIVNNSGGVYAPGIDE